MPPTKSKSKTKKRKQPGQNGTSQQNGTTSSASSPAARKQKVDAIKKKLKIGKLKDLSKQPDLAGSVKGKLDKAFTVNSGKSRMLIFKDSEGIKLNIQKIEKGKGDEIGNTLRAVFEKMIKDLDNNPIAQITTNLDNLSNLETLQKELASLQSDELIKGVKRVNMDREINRFLENKVLPPEDQRDPKESTITYVKNYLERESSGRKKNENYKEIIRLLDVAAREDKDLESNPDKVQSDISKLFVLRNQIQEQLDGAASTNRNADLQDHRNAALDNMLVLLDQHMMSKTWATGKMTINDQKMVASGADMEAIKNKLKDMKAKDIELTPDQAWAIVAAEKKAITDKPKFVAATAKRLETLNKDWGTNYTMDDIETLKNHMSQLKVATNYFLGAPPGANTNSQVSQDKTLGELLLESDTFKNVWETRASQAAVQDHRRGAIEEQMGYAQALDRTAGEFQDQNDTLGRFDNVKNPEALPKYAALVSTDQIYGVAQRYGESVVTWKNDAVAERMTHTPGDSWNQGLGQGVNNFTSLKDPYSVFAHADPKHLRYLLGEATGKDQTWFQDQKKNGAPISSYIETQIHGNLEWGHVEKIVLGFDSEKGPDENWAKDYAQKLEAFKKEKGFNFEVAIRDESGKITKVEAVVPSVVVERQEEVTI